MSRDHQRKAEARLEKALEETGARDPREFFRGILRDLKARDETRYRSAVADFEERVVRAIAEEEADPIRAWLEFGLRLAERVHPGRAVVVDPTGRAEPYAPPPSVEMLILHLPDEGRARAVPIGLPPVMSGPQQAALDLLCHGKVRLADA